jgi:hypothetical protein
MHSSHRDSCLIKINYFSFDEMYRLSLCCVHYEKRCFMEREMKHKEFVLIKLLLFANCFLFFSCISSMNVIWVRGIAFWYEKWKYSLHNSLISCFVCPSYLVQIKINHHSIYVIKEYIIILAMQADASKGRYHHINGCNKKRHHLLLDANKRRNHHINKC